MSELVGTVTGRRGGNESIFLFLAGETDFSLLQKFTPATEFIQSPI